MEIDYLKKKWASQDKLMETYFNSINEWLKSNSAKYGYNYIEEVN